MAYELLPTKDDESLFFRLDRNSAESHGQIGYLRIDFGKTGHEFYSTWFDVQPQLNTYSFKTKLDEVVNALRDDGQNPPLASRGNLEAFCARIPGKRLAERGYGYMVRTLDYSCYFRCKPCLGDYDVYCFAYDNSFLLRNNIAMGVQQCEN
jgi:hypothetical protein